MLTLFRLFYELTIARLEDHRRDAQAIGDEILKKWRLRDPCGTYYLARTLAAIEHPSALATFSRAVDGGYYCYSFFTHDPWLDPLRGTAEFTGIVRRAEAGYRDAAEAFVAGGGERVLGAVQQE